MVANCKIKGCNDAAWIRGYASRYNDYCKEHGEEREILDYKDLYKEGGEDE